MEQLIKGFTSSVILDNHPMKHVKPQIKEQYYIALKYFINQLGNFEVIEYRLRQYKDLLVGEKELCISEGKINKVVQVIVYNRYQPWRKKYRYWLLCDIALICLSEDMTLKAFDLVSSFLSKRQKAQFQILIKALCDKESAEIAFPFVNEYIEQYHKNMEFVKAPELRLIVTANMSAGKSTLINALIGKSIARTSQEVCTGNVCYIYSKPFEDGHIHLDTGLLNMNASAMDLTEFDWSKKTRIASYFRAFNVWVPRVCIIDTPGVNSAINRQHGRIAKNALQSEQYDKLIYVINGNKLGSDEEIKHLRWVADNISKEKILFVLNKLDDFKRVDDDIQISINCVCDDLRKLGFEEPKVYPISAYFGMLIKKKEFGEQLTEDEQDEYEYYKKKFNRPEYDLARYGNNCSNKTEHEAIALSKRCGLYSLEEAIYGGRQ